GKCLVDSLDCLETIVLFALCLKVLGNLLPCFWRQILEGFNSAGNFGIFKIPDCHWGLTLTSTDTESRGNKQQAYLDVSWDCHEVLHACLHWPFGQQALLT